MYLNNIWNISSVLSRRSLQLQHLESIYFSPLRPISGVSQHRVLLVFLFVPSHQLSIIFISKQTLQAWYYRRPHDLRRNSLPGRLPLDIARIIFSDLVTQCTAYGACIQILVLTSVEDAVVGGMHVSSALLILDGKQVIWLHMLW